MLTPQLLQSVKAYTANLSHLVTLELGQGEHEKRKELIQFLTDLASVSEKIDFDSTATRTDLASGLSFTLGTPEGDTGIQFTGIPGGHEFSSLVLAILQAGGAALKLDPAIQTLIKRINTPLRFETYVSLSCHNCPDVVQALNQFALLNPHISHEMVDGGPFQARINALNIQGVPAVYLNGEPFANGKIDTAQLLEKLTERFPEIAKTDAEPSRETQDVTIIGGGPAGVAAAIYTARKGLKVTLIADRIGGQLKDTLGIENFISLPKTTGPELSKALSEHMADYAITVKDNQRVKSFALANSGGPHRLELSTGEALESKTLIVASGAKWRELGVPGEKENIGQGVAYCPHCDGPFFKGKDIAVIGGGNSGVEAALDLSGIVKSVTLLEFLPELKADQVLVEQLKTRDNIQVLTNVVTESIQAKDNAVNALVYRPRDQEEPITLPLSGVFVQIGLLPNSELLKGQLELNRYGEVIINERCETNIEGVFAAGDVTTTPYKQIIAAMGDGAKAGLSAFDYLLKLKP